MPPHTATVSMAGALLAAITAVSAAGLGDICTDAYARAALPVDALTGITIDASSVSTQLVANYTASSIFYPTDTFDYCNLTFAYAHDGIDGDVVHVQYWLPAPDRFQNRYVSTGGGGWAINSGSSSIPTGVIVGGVSGLTDGGFGSFDTQFSEVALLADGTINWQATYMFGYQAHHELAVLGKALTRNLYGVANATKLYAYYQGCSEGGREGWSQVQRFPDQFDGIAVAAPAFRWAQQQVNHLAGNVMEQTLGYVPPSCELDAIVNRTIAVCDPLDGRADGVVARSDLCLDHLGDGLDGLVGLPYACAASAGDPAYGTPATPAQSGRVSAAAVRLVRTYWDGLHDAAGRRVYMGYQPGAALTDLATVYDNATGRWQLAISSLGGLWVAQFVERRAGATNLASLAGVSYDTLRDWMVYSQATYGDILQTTYPDLTAFQAAGGKAVHVHGEQDFSIPTAASVRYWDAVRTVQFPGRSYAAGAAALDDFYRLFLVPGASHCAVNSDQPGGPWPPTTLQTVIAWVEEGRPPDTLAGTGAMDQICRWPQRPQWTDGGRTFQCVFDQRAVDRFTYDLDAYKLPVY